MRRTSYFISQGWLWGNENLGYEYDRIKEKHGEKRALRVVKTMYKNYRYLMYVNTGIEEDRVRHDCSTVAERLGLQLQETRGDIHLLLNMLNGVMDDRYLIVPPEGYVTEEMFRNSRKCYKNGISLLSKYHFCNTTILKIIRPHSTCDYAL